MTSKGLPPGRSRVVGGDERRSHCGHFLHIFPHRVFPSQSSSKVFLLIPTVLKTLPKVYDELSPCFRRYAAKKVRDTMRTLIFLRAPRRNKVFPNHSQSSWGHGKSSWGHSQSHSRDLPNQNQSSRGVPDQDQPQHFRAGGEWPAHQARYQLLKIIKSKIIQDIPRLFFYYIYQNCQGRSQFLEVEVLHRQKEEQGDEPPVTSAINVSYI